jgi:small subunit ribosomal protein S5
MVQQGQNRDRKRRDRRRGEEDDGPEFIEKVVFINRVSKVVKGGRRFSFTAVVVIGDGNGVPEAIRKGGVIARRAMINVKLREGTVVHEALAKFKSSKVVIRPASPGTGIIAGGAVRAVMEAVGVRDVLTKSLGSNTPINVVRATIEALESMRLPEDVVARRHALRDQAEQAAARAS